MHNKFLIDGHHVQERHPSRNEKTDWPSALRSVCAPGYSCRCRLSPDACRNDIQRMDIPRGHVRSWSGIPRIWMDQVHVRSAVIDGWQLSLKEYCEWNKGPITATNHFLKSNCCQSFKSVLIIGELNKILKN